MAPPAKLEPGLERGFLFGGWCRIFLEASNWTKKLKRILKKHTGTQGAVILISCCNLWNCVQIAHWRGRHTGPRERIRRPHRGKNWTAWDLPKAHWMDQATWQERQTQQV
eukprot:s4638_g3.t1